MLLQNKEVETTNEGPFYFILHLYWEEETFSKAKSDISAWLKCMYFIFCLCDYS